MKYAAIYTISEKSNHLQSDDWIQNHHGGKWESALIQRLWIFSLKASRASSRNCRRITATWGPVMWCIRRSPELPAPAYGSTAALRISSWNQTDPLPTHCQTLEDVAGRGSFYSVNPNALTSVTCNQSESALNCKEMLEEERRKDHWNPGCR